VTPGHYIAAIVITWIVLATIAALQQRRKT
jgi:hypothetical protein